MNLSQKQNNRFPDRVQQWAIQHRLEELGINRSPSPPSIGIGIQIWCVTRAVLASRQEQVNFLEQCWRLRHEQAN